MKYRCLSRLTHFWRPHEDQSKCGSKSVKRDSWELFTCSSIIGTLPHVSNGRVTGEIEQHAVVFHYEHMFLPSYKWWSLKCVTQTWGSKIIQCVTHRANTLYHIIGYHTLQGLFIFDVWGENTG